MDLRYLRFFIAVAEEANFTRAAERLHTSQPSLSNQIKRLEEIVGAPLFTRDKHQTHLTAVGEEFLKHSYKLLDNFNLALEAVREVARAEEGELTIGYLSGSESIIFPEMLSTLHDQFPGMKFHLMSGHSPLLVAALLNGVLDVVFCERIADSTIAQEVVRRLTLVAAIPANHQLAVFDRIPLGEFAKYPFVAPEAKKFPGAWKIFDSLATRAGVVFRLSAEVDNALATVNAVQSGLGVAIIPEHIIPKMPSDVLIRHLEVEPQPCVDYCISYCRDNTLPQAVIYALLQYFSEKREAEPAEFTEGCS